MADYESGSITFSGLGSGTDFNSIVDQLKKVESIQLNRLKNWKSDWNERYIAFGDIISTVRDAKSQLADMNSPSKFLKKNGTSTNENVLTVKATADAVDGSHMVNVKQLASNAIWASTRTYTGKDANFNTTGTQQAFTYTYKGTTRTVSIAPGTTLESFVNIINKDQENPGVKASLIQVSGGYTFQIQGKESGADADLSIHPTALGDMGGAAATSTWKSNTAVIDPAAALSTLGNTVETQNYTLTMGDGTIYTFSLNGDDTKQALVDAINAKAPDSAVIEDGKLTLTGIKSLEVSSATGGSSTIKGKATSSMAFTAALTDSIGDAGSLYYVNLTKTDGSQTLIELEGTTSYKDMLQKIKDEGFEVTTSGDATSGYTWTVKDAVSLTSSVAGTTCEGGWKASQNAVATDPVQAGVVSKNLQYTLTKADGSTVTIDLTSDQTLQDFADAVNAQMGAGTATFVTGDDGRQYLQMENVYNVSGGVGVSGQINTSSNWAIRRASDAVFTVDNWPQEMVSSTNNVADVLEGVTLTLKDLGTAQISVASDLDSVRDNIQAFLDTINTVVKKVQDLTKVDSEKTVASSDKDNSNYSASQWDQEQGSLLTGNYGVQLFNTRMKSLMSASATGFTKVTGADFLSGDFVTALSQIGIKTDTEEGSPTYGMFCIAPACGNAEMQQLDQDRFEDAIANHLDDVISIFAADDEGSTNSADFRYGQHIKGMTMAGSYSVEYTVDDNNQVTEVLINGVKANQSDLDEKMYTVSSAGDATGMSIIIDNFTAGKHEGTVSIKQGKVRQMEDFFTKELVYYAPNINDPTISENNGALMILQANYKQIMDNAETKIQKEQDRIDRWEKNQRQAFARLETLLGQYQQNQASLESQLAQFN